jgi:single-strand DNA-binding protein
MVIGNATRDPELRTTPNGHSVASFAIATNRRWNDNGETREEVQYHEIVAWGKLAEIVNQIIKKGGKVYAEGRLQTRSWEGQDGAKRERTEIIAENIIALSGRPAGSGDYQAPSEPQTASDKSEKKPAETKTKETPIEDEINLDDIPF